MDIAGYILKFCILFLIQAYKKRLSINLSLQDLKLKEPFLHELVSILADQFDEIFPEVKKQKSFIEKVKVTIANQLKTIERKSTIKKSLKTK